jgi:predicted nucleotidyltransferase
MIQAMPVRTKTRAKTDANGAAASMRPRDGGRPMQLAKVVQILRDRADDLRHVGIRHLSVFGSLARGEARSDSDVDLLVDLDPMRRLDIFDVSDIAAQIEELLGVEVDLIRRNRIAREFRERALRDEVVVF